jgi:hypothetical protein
MRKTLKYIILPITVLIILAAIIFGKGDIPVEKLKDKYAPLPSQFLEIEGINVHFRDEGNPQNTIPVENAYRFQNDLPNDSLVVFNDLVHIPTEEEGKQTA